MANKKRLITAVVLVVATITVVLVVGTVAAILFFRFSGDTDTMPGATAVGVPNGPATTKKIGSAGGSIASPDGRIIVDIPFTVNAANPLWSTAIKFVPSSTEAGTYSFNTHWRTLTIEGSGTYTIQGADTDKPRILVEGSGSARAPEGGASNSGIGHIDLVPLETGECK